MAPTRTIAFMNQKGGVGKTTTAVNLAAALARAGHAVGVIDLDPQAHLTLHLGVEVAPDDTSVYDVLVDAEVRVEDALVKAANDVFVLPAVTDLAAAEVELADAPDRTLRLARKCAACATMRHLDFLLIDCPPSLGLLTLNGLALAREVMVPMQAHFLALQGLSKLLETVSLVSAEVNPALRVSGVLLCMFEGQTRLAQEVVSDLDAFFESSRNQPVPWRDCRVLKPPIRRNIKLAESPSFGASIFDYDAHCPGAEDYRNLAACLARQEQPTSQPGSTLAELGEDAAALPEVIVAPTNASARSPAVTYASGTGERP